MDHIARPPNAMAEDGKSTQSHSFAFHDGLYVASGFMKRSVENTKKIRNTMHVIATPRLLWRLRVHLFHRKKHGGVGTRSGGGAGVVSQQAAKEGHVQHKEKRSLLCAWLQRHHKPSFALRRRGARRKRFPSCFCFFFLGPKGSSLRDEERTEDGPLCALVHKLCNRK